MNATVWWSKFRSLSAARKTLRGGERALRRISAERRQTDAITRLEKSVTELADVVARKPRDYRLLERLTASVVSQLQTAKLVRETAPVVWLSWFLPGIAAKASKSVLRQYLESIGWAVGIALLIRFFLFEPFKIPTGSMIPTLQIGDHIFVSKSAYGIKIPFSDDYLVRWSAPVRGDIVVFPFPVKGHVDHGKDFIKRVIGLPGDTVRLQDNVLQVNGKPVDTVLRDESLDCGGTPGSRPCEKCVLQEESVGELTYLTQHCPPDTIQHPDWPRSLSFSPAKEFVVPEDRVFVMGDNRDNSADGRFWTANPLDQHTPQYSPDPTVQSVPIAALKGRAVLIWWARDKSRLFSIIH
jgi:signal peptidase I